MNKKLIIFGLSNIAECAYEYFAHDSDYEVCAFCVDKSYIKYGQIEHFGLPIIAFEDVLNFYSPQDYSFFVAITSRALNRLRTQKVQAVKDKGYSLASYISSRAFVWPNVKIGEHVCIQEHNTVQPFVEIGNNVVLWAGNHIGHNTVIEDNCFIASHVVISGDCRIGKNSFIGVNAAIANNVTIGRDNFIGMGVSILRDTEEDKIYKPAKSEQVGLSAKKFTKVLE